jgi:hypothetical protein
LLPVLKNPNGIYIQEGVGNVDNFQATFSKMIFCPFFFGFLNILGKNKTIMEKLFS